MNALLPVALLLFWSGLAATACAAFLIAPLIGLETAALAPEPHRPSVAGALAAGALLYPIPYGIAFGLMGEASIVTGALLGVIHALVLLVRSAHRGGTDLVRDNQPRMLLLVAYGALLGFVFVTP